MFPFLDKAVENIIKQPIDTYYEICYHVIRSLIRKCCIAEDAAKVPYAYKNVGNIRALAYYTTK